jgi:DDE superfamily endonuclease
VTDFLQDHPAGQVLALDEMSLYFQATTTRVWSPKGQTPQVRVSGQRDHVHFYGAVNLNTGHEVAWPCQRLNSDTTVSFLHEILTAYPTQPLLLLWDRAPWHKGEAVRQALADNGRVQTMVFPPACPQLNPQEHVWSQARAAVSHNHMMTDFGHLHDTFLGYLGRTTFRFRWLEKYTPPSFRVT